MSFFTISLSACLICALLLLITYSGFILLGAESFNKLTFVDPSQRLLFLSTDILGNYSIPIVSSIIFLACLTTMCALTEIFADFAARFVNFRQSTLILLTIVISYLYHL
jgi:branched-subunit amino acid permease